LAIPTTHERSYASLSLAEETTSQLELTCHYYWRHDLDLLIENKGRAAECFIMKWLNINVEGREIEVRGGTAEGSAKLLPQLTKVTLRETPER